MQTTPPYLYSDTNVTAQQPASIQPNDCPPPNGTPIAVVRYMFDVLHCPVRALRCLPGVLLLLTGARPSSRASTSCC